MWTRAQFLPTWTNLGGNHLQVHLDLLTDKRHSIALTSISSVTAWIPIPFFLTPSWLAFPPQQLSVDCCCLIQLVFMSLFLVELLGSVWHVWPPFPSNLVLLLPPLTSFLHLYCGINWNSAILSLSVWAWGGVAKWLLHISALRFQSKRQWNMLTTEHSHLHSPGSQPENATTIWSLSAGRATHSIFTPSLQSNPYHLHPTFSLLNSPLVTWPWLISTRLLYLY